MDLNSLTLVKVVSLAIVDAINPCALAVLAMMLLAIISFNPDKRKKVLFSGFAFSLAVFSMYIVYGLLIIKFFKLISIISGVKMYFYRTLGGFAILLGIIQIKDFFAYKPGTIGTEMPLFLRPKVKKIISNATSPISAFLIGLFVTLFLLPCTIGPYVLLGGMLSVYDFAKSLPILLLYNFIFVSPMLLITAVVYLSLKNVHDVTSWKDRNIRIIHLVSGIIMFLLGLIMFLS